MDGGKSQLESLLGCSVHHYVRLKATPLPSFRVYVQESDAQSAISGKCARGMALVGFRNDKLVLDSRHSSCISAIC